MDEKQAFFADTDAMSYFGGGRKGRQRPGVKKGRLAPCPSSPNCVSSFEKDEARHVPPITYTADMKQSYTRLVATLENLPESRIVSRTERSIHAEFRSSFFGFMDDVEFLFPEGKKIIHVRSASRAGYSDFGANRKRVEKIRYLFGQHRKDGE